MNGNDVYLRTQDEEADFERGSVYFVGTATVIIRYGGFRILTDPNFLHAGDHVHLGYGLTSERLTNPAIEMEDLPDLDFVLLSHLHGDHFDRVILYEDHYTRGRAPGEIIALFRRGLAAGVRVAQVDEVMGAVKSIEAALKQLRPGDLLLVHTGWTRWFLDADVQLRAEVRDARRATGFRQSRDLPAWLWDHQIALFATDTFAVEVLPVVPDSPYLDTAPEDAGMMHQELIAKLGVPLGELWNLTDLVADSWRTGRWDALVVVKPLHLVGGVGSPPNATALR